MSVLPWVFIQKASAEFDKLCQAVTQCDGGYVLLSALGELVHQLDLERRECDLWFRVFRHTIDHGYSERFERELLSERPVAGLASTCTHSRVGGRTYKMIIAKFCLAMAAMGKSKTNVSTMRAELRVTRQTLYRPVSPAGEFSC